MPKVTDEELDRLFRDAAESNHPDFDSGDWDDMSQKLVREEKAAKARNRTLYSVVTLLILYSLWSPFGDSKLQTASMNPLGIAEFSRSEKSTPLADERVIEEFKASDQSVQSGELTDENVTKQKAVEQSVQATPTENESASIAPAKKELTAPVVVDRTSHKSDNDLNAARAKANQEQKREHVKESDSKENSESIFDVAGSERVKDASETKKRGSNVDTREHAVVTNTESSKQTESNVTNDSSVDNLNDQNISGNENKNLPTVKNEVAEVNKGDEISAGENKKDVDNGGFKSLAVQGGSENGIAANQNGPTHDFPVLLVARERKLPSLFEPAEKGKEIKVVQVTKPAITQGETVIKKDALQSKHPWFIKLPVSPDFSSIDYGSTGKTGINIGLLGEYYLTKHISVSAGAIWSKKLYDQQNPNRVYNAGNWQAAVKKLDGDCRVLDIPLNFTYYLFPERKTNYFITVGSSSYIMLNEDYKYTVWKNQQYMTYDQQISHKNNEWFSMLNVSIGIQQRVSQRFMLQLEPFLKAPISGVGEGKVNLVSTGAFLSLKYQLTK